MPGYFTVPMADARAILAASEGPDLLAAYIVLRDGAYGAARNLSACGASAIRKSIGCTDYRSKHVLGDLLSVTREDRSKIVTRTGTMLGNAPIYSMQTRNGPAAALPSIFVKVAGRSMEGALHRLCGLEDSEAIKRDALFLLLYLYSCTDYGGCMAAPADAFAYQEWDRDGVREIGDVVVELDRVGGVDNKTLWLVAPPEAATWKFSKRVEALIGAERAAPALDLLIDVGFVCQVAIVADGRKCYPLWLFNPGYRNSLAELGVITNLAAGIHKLALDLGVEAARDIVVEAVNLEAGSFGTGLFYCVSKRTPTVRSLLAPRLHAPTAQNLDGLQEMRVVTQTMQNEINRWRSRAKAA
jgi:hypothetical protein